MSKLIDNLDGTIEFLYEEGEISLYLKSFLKIEVHRLNKLRLLFWAKSTNLDSRKPLL